MGGFGKKEGASEEIDDNEQGGFYELGGSVPYLK